MKSAGDARRQEWNMGRDRHFESEKKRADNQLKPASERPSTAQQESCGSRP
jgi:hypothetical protein